MSALGALLAICCAVAAGGCGSAAPASTAEARLPEMDVARTAPSSTTVVGATSAWNLGAFLSMTGPEAVFGADAKKGFELAIEQVNARGGAKGRPVAIRYADNASDSNLTVDRVGALIDRDDVVALLGDIASSRARVGGIVANARQVPMITPGATHPDVTRVGPFVFRACVTDDAQARASARHLIETEGKQRVVVLIRADDRYSGIMAEAFRAEANRLGRAPVGEVVLTADETGIRRAIDAIKRGRPDVVYAPLYYHDVTRFASQARVAGLPGSLFFGTDGWEASDLLRDAGAHLEGAALTVHWAADAPFPANERFVADYRSRFGEEPTSVAALSYEAATMVVDAIERAADGSRVSIRKALASTKGFVGLTGPITMDDTRDPKRPVVVVGIRSGKFVFRSVIAPAP